MNLLERFRKFIATNNLFSSKDKLLLAVSGGVDSVVLCELCKQAG
jgi:tRNA(Ile)-lysidine synthase